MKQKENSKVPEEMVLDPKSRKAVKQSHDNIHDNNSRYVVLA